MMLTVQELFTRLSHGPFSNIALGNNGDGTIPDEKQGSIIEFTNDALLRLHTRFLLRERELIIKQYHGETNYPITPQNTVSYYTSQVNPTELPFIQDSVAVPFDNDLIKILHVYDACGDVYALNDSEADYSLFTPRVNLLQVPCPVNGELLYVLYQARHLKLDATTIDLGAQIDIPAVLEEALIAYIAHKGFLHMNGQEHKVRAADHLATFDLICTEGELKDIVNSSVSTTSGKFHSRGFR
jgi:hypothetical protein